VATLSFDRRLGLLLELEIDQPHRVVGVTEIELLVRGREVLDDPLDVRLYQQALQFGADAERVDEDGLHRTRYDKERVGRRIETERHTEPDVQGLIAAAPGVYHEGVRRHQYGPPPRDAGDADVDRGGGRALGVARGSGRPERDITLRRSSELGPGLCRSPGLRRSTGGCRCSPGSQILLSRSCCATT